MTFVTGTLGAGDGACLKPESAGADGAPDGFGAV
jgi:hypothetical protein